MTDIFQKQLAAAEVQLAYTHEGTEGYGPMPLRNLHVGAEIPFDMYLKIKEKGKTKPHLLKCCDWGEVFQEEWYQKLTELKIPCVYVPLAQMELALRYLQQNLEAALADDTKDELEKGTLVCDATHMWVLNFFNSKEARTGEQIKLAKEFLEALFEVIQSDPQNLMYLMEIRRHSFRLYSHCLNVCMLGLAFTNYLGWTGEKIQGFGLGALLHDIGLIRMPQAVLEKKEALTKEEMAAIKRHPTDGVRMVQDLDDLTGEALQMVLRHHENGDGSGYPDGLRGSDIHPWARVLRILDSYEAMTSERSWRPALKPNEALWIMRNEWKKSKRYDQHYMMNFIKFLADN